MNKFYDEQTGLVSPKSGLPSSRTIGGRKYICLNTTAQPHTLLKCRIYPCKTKPIPQGMVPTKIFTIEIIDRIAYQTFNLIFAAEAQAEINAKQEALIAKHATTYRDDLLNLYELLSHFDDLSIVDDGYNGIMQKAYQQIQLADDQDQIDRLADILMAKSLFKDKLQPASIEGEHLQNCIIYAISHPEPAQ